MSGNRVTRVVGYVWASPTTAVGCVFAIFTWITGGDVERRDGVIEVRRALARSVLESPRVRADALTLGHVIFARDAETMERHRYHELGHVRQCERLGPFFLPVYVLAGVVASARGGSYYRDNWFERDADRRAAAAMAALTSAPSDGARRG